jgi:hypothetical protein
MSLSRRYLNSPHMLASVNRKSLLDGTVILTASVNGTIRFWMLPEEKRRFGAGAGEDLSDVALRLMNHNVSQKSLAGMKGGGQRGARPGSGGNGGGRGSDQGQGGQGGAGDELDPAFGPKESKMMFQMWLAADRGTAGAEAADSLSKTARRSSIGSRPTSPVIPTMSAMTAASPGGMGMAASSMEDEMMD